MKNGRKETGPGVQYLIAVTKNRGKEITENVSETFSELRHTGCQTERIHEMHSKVDFYRLISHLTLL